MDSNLKSPLLSLPTLGRSPPFRVAFDGVFFDPAVPQVYFGPPEDRRRFRCVEVDKMGDFMLTCTLPRAAGMDNIFTVVFSDSGQNISGTDLLSFPPPEILPNSLDCVTRSTSAAQTCVRKDLITSIMLDNLGTDPQVIQFKANHALLYGQTAR